MRRYVVDQAGLTVRVWRPNGFAQVRWPARLAAQFVAWDKRRSRLGAQSVLVRDLRAPAVVHWGDAEVRLESDGSAIRLVRGQNLVVEIGWVHAEGSEPAVITDEEVEHELATQAGRLLQRAAVGDGWRNRWVLVRDHDGSVQVEERLRVRPGPEFALWSWDAGVSAMFTIAPAHASGPVLAFRLEQGYLEQAEPVTSPSSSAVEFLVAPIGTVLEVGDRMVTVLAAQSYPTMADFETKLPAWMLETQCDDGVTWWGDLADFGVSVPDGLELGYFDGAVSVDGPAGRRVIEVTSPKGLSRVPLEWVPQVQEVLHRVAAATLAAEAEPSVAEAFCVQLAADRNTVWLDDAAHDRLDRVDWHNSDSLLAGAFALARGRSQGEAALISDALRWLARQPVGVGYGRVAMAGFLASVTVGLDAQSRCLDLLARTAVGRTAALESSLLHYRSADFGHAELAGVVNRLGGLLPGQAPLLGWSEFAQLIGLLELCPPEWPDAAYYAQVASKARGTLLCAYVDGRVAEAEPLAWLMLSPELSSTA